MDPPLQFMNPFPLSQDGIKELGKPKEITEDYAQNLFPTMLHQLMYNTDHLIKGNAVLSSCNPYSIYNCLYSID